MRRTTVVRAPAPALLELTLPTGNIRERVNERFDNPSPASNLDYNAVDNNTHGGVVFGYPVGRGERRHRKRRRVNGIPDTTPVETASDTHFFTAFDAGGERVVKTFATRPSRSSGGIGRFHPP